MGWRKILSICLQIPAWTILFGGLLISFFAYLNKIQNVSIFTPIFLLIVDILYVIGYWFLKDKEVSEIIENADDDINEEEEGYPRFISEEIEN